MRVASNIVSIGSVAAHMNHRIVECFGLERAFKDHIVQPPCSAQGHLLDQVAQNPIQPELECFQGWGLHYLSGQHLPVFHHPHCKKFLLI